MESSKFPKKVTELRSLLEGKTRDEAHKLTFELLGEPNRDVGSGFRIWQWDIDGGILTFHQGVGPVFSDAVGTTTWLIATNNEVESNLHGEFEMYSLQEQDPKKYGTSYWLGNITLSPTGNYEYRDSGQHREYKKRFPRHFFAGHFTGEFEIVYSGGIKATDALEVIPDETEICKITFQSGDSSETFGIVTSRSGRRLHFESGGQVFQMNRGWNEYWPKVTENQNNRMDSKD
ncbi:MAG: hypothetical protein IH898_05400 [Planctomycetes bacterium]|nr:hypothetical protein [Planctomycetota bacterium]